MSKNWKCLIFFIVFVRNCLIVRLVYFEDFLNLIFVMYLEFFNKKIFSYMYVNGYCKMGVGIYMFIIKVYNCWELLLFFLFYWSLLLI